MRKKKKEILKQLTELSKKVDEETLMLFSENERLLLKVQQLELAISNIIAPPTTTPITRVYLENDIIDFRAHFGKKIGQVYITNKEYLDHCIKTMPYFDYTTDNPQIIQAKKNMDLLKTQNLSQL